MFCDRCGVQLLARQSLCGRCEVPTTRQWLQFISLAVLTVVVLFNSLAMVLLVGRTPGTGALRWLFRTWLGASEILGSYGWLLISVAVLTWAFWPRYGYTPESEVKMARILLIILLGSSILWTVLPYVPADYTGGVGPMLLSYPRLALILVWATVLGVLMLLCFNPETRDFLLGDGRILASVSLGLLLAVTSLAVAAWALTGSP